MGRHFEQVMVMVVGGFWTCFMIQIDSFFKCHKWLRKFLSLTIISNIDIQFILK